MKYMQQLVDYFRRLFGFKQQPEPEDDLLAIQHLQSVSAHPKLSLFTAKLAQFFYRYRPTYSERTKRVFDCVVTSIGLLAISPLMMMTAIAIKLDSKGSIFYSQTRIGKDGKHFKLWKFRSMRTDADKHLAALLQENEVEGGVIFKMKEDPRVTRVGRFIRRYSIDELPQLWNVLLGDMSLVGPRPCLTNELDKYRVDDLKRLNALPGLTGLWQISGRSNTTFNEQMCLDIDYVYERSFIGDIKIILKTIPAIVKGEGAY